MKPALHWTLLFRLLILAVGAGLGHAGRVRADEAQALGGAEDYFDPPALTATITGSGGGANTESFRFRREAVGDGSSVHVLREYTRPDGTVVARERVVYRSGKLISFELEEPLSGAHGHVSVQLESGDARKGSLKFEYTSETGAQKERTEDLQPDTLVNDMVGPFIAGHWGILAQGGTVKARFIAVARAETVGFKFTKESESTWRGRPVVIIRMQPSSWVIARIVKPLEFVVDRAAPHRVLQYTGRTTPRLKQGKRWDDFDAVTVFDWR